MKRILAALRQFLTMTDEDYASADALSEVLVKDLAFRLTVELTLASLFVWTGEPGIAAIWLIIVIPAEFCEVRLHAWIRDSERLTPLHLYCQFGNSIWGGGAWSLVGTYLWTTGNVYHMAAGLTMIIGVMMHVTFKYVDWLKGAIVAAMPAAIAFFILAWLPTGIDAPLGFRVLTVLTFTGLMYYMYIVAAASITKQIELKKALESASAASQFKSIFLANMSHEIRTPMNGVLGMADLLDRTKLNSNQKEMVSIIQSSGDTLIRVIDDILDLSKIEAGHLALEDNVFSLDDLVRTVVATSEMAARDKNLTFTCVRETEGNSHFLGDALRLRQVIGNLVSNAIKFTAKGSVVLELETHQLPGASDCELTFRVTDTGPGLSEEAQEKIFRPFVQADGSMSRQHGGSGLGLAIARNIAEAMGGKLWVESKLGEGATFTFVCTLPVAEAPPDERAGVLDPDRMALRPLSGHRPSILVAEDHPFNRRVIELMLGSLDVDVTFAENGTQAVQACEDAHFDLVLMDIQMPGLTGVEALGLIRAREHDAGLAPVPMIALTANAMKHQVDEYQAAGFDGHLPKPIIIEDLVGIVNSVLGSAQAR